MLINSFKKISAAVGIVVNLRCFKPEILPKEYSSSLEKRKINQPRLLETKENIPNA
jgi:hypothetical protein